MTGSKIPLPPQLPHPLLSPLQVIRNATNSAGANNVTKPTTALLAVLLLAGCTRTDVEAGADTGPERIEAWQTVESYKIDQRMNTLRVGQWLREPGNEDKSLEEAEAALGLQELDPHYIDLTTTYVVVDRDGVVRGRSHEVESLYDVILEATDADDETRAKLVGDEPATPSAGSSDLAQPEYNIEAQEWITMPLAADTSIWTPPYFDAGGGEIWMITRSVPARDAGGIFAIVTTDLPVDAPGR